MISMNGVPWSSPVLQQSCGLEDALQPLLGPIHSFANVSISNSSQLKPFSGDAKLWDWVPETPQDVEYFQTTAKFLADLCLLEVPQSPWDTWK